MERAVVMTCTAASHQGVIKAASLLRTSETHPVRTHSHSRIVNRRQLQIFSMPNISRVSATHWRFPQIASLMTHTARFVLHERAPICPDVGICWRVKNLLAKIVLCELGIRVLILIAPIHC